VNDTVNDLAIKFSDTAKQLTEVIFAYPTLSEPVIETAEGIFGQSVHLTKARK
jgi:hypothetical protein